MQTQNRFFEDLSKFLNGVAGTAAGMGREAEAAAKSKAKEWVGGLDMVSREEFDAVKAMAAKARAEVDLLKLRLDALEGKKPAAKSPPLKKAPSPKVASPKAKAKPAAPLKAGATRKAPTQKG